MQRPCSTRNASSVPNDGASGRSSDGTTISPLAATSDARRPIRSESGPQNQPPSATAAITAEMLSPARAGETPNSRPSLGQDRLRRVHDGEHRPCREQERTHGAQRRALAHADSVARRAL